MEHGKRALVRSANDSILDTRRSQAKVHRAIRRTVLMELIYGNERIVVGVALIVGAILTAYALLGDSR